MSTLSSTALLSGKRFCGTILLCLLATMASHAQTFTTIASFNLTNGDGPAAALIQGPDGNFYGTTGAGGSNSRCGSALGCGTVFQVTSAGNVTTLHSFCSQTNCTDGSEVYAGLALGLNGNFYGTTYLGGAYNHGTVFEITPQGKLTTLHSFCAQTGCPDGSGPLSGLTLGHDGNFYGTTVAGGSPNNDGVAYKISPTGNFTLLHSFCTERGSCGFRPQGPLALATNGKFYGTTINGGINNGGVIFQLASSGVVTIVHAFSDAADQFNVSNGVTQAADGNLYGAADEGGSNSGGYVFQLTPKGQFTDLYNFCSQTGCSDGVFPQSQLIQGTDGNLYGTTSGAGAGFSYGTVFQITTTGNLTTLYSFCSQTNCPDGNTSQAGLLQATNGTFYGTTAAGGTPSPHCSTGCGTVFSLSMGLAAFVQPYPAFGKTGHMVGILGNNLTGTTQVTFNGTPAQFTVVSDTLIKATVPTGATTGSIQVTTSNGTLVSNVAFLVE